MMENNSEFTSFFDLSCISSGVLLGLKEKRNPSSWKFFTTPSTVLTMTENQQKTPTLYSQPTVVLSDREHSEN